MEEDEQEGAIGAVRSEGGEGDDDEDEDEEDEVEVEEDTKDGGKRYT